ncbi:DUF1349 domain-containing protein [Nocardioides sp. TF02-7]|uniref:OmpL47-type beta-barrel domain-containing protein n=1 Tax=Nocardioides sp. TF02-7 TaxID=2917724 RepID=UPI001F057EE6|nr:DUF1349 domain-containing protein [Nocardioides sp. TF02-7]UMG94478.1 DUF1349 domain-containing protein [Nocardioides sp. TF02-7]
MTASVDWFRVTPDRDAPEFTPDDEFDGDELDGCRWAHTVRYDSETVEVADGHLKVETQPGDINGNNPVNPRNFVLQAAPEGDWVATTRFKAPLVHRWQLAGLLMYADDDNYVKADVVAYNTPGAALDLRAELAAESNGSGVSGGDQVDIADTTESGYWYVRVTKAGSQYTAEVSDDGAQWEPVGNGIAFDKPITALGLMAIGPEQEEPVTVEFDYFHLETDGEEPEDTEAPTTELTLDPAAADGENGWYVTAPSFTLSADDGDGSGVDTTEYRVDGGEWTEYDGTVGLGDLTDGEREVEYRSTDVAGNVEDAGSTTVKLDRAAPETTAEVTDDGVAKVVTLLAEDAASGVASTEIKVGDGEWTAYDQPVRIDEPGDHVVSFRSTDNAGHVEEAGSVEVTVEEPDTEAPVTELTLDPAAADGENGWYVTAPSFTLAADAGEGSDVASTEYRIDGGEWTAYDGEPVALGDLADGEIVVEYRSTDADGNVEEVRSSTVKLDRAGPTTTAEVTDDGTAKVVTLTAEDATSGVASTEVKVGDGDWTTYDQPVRIDEPGDHVVSFRSTDHAGHVEEAGSVEVTVEEPDTTGPVLEVRGSRPAGPTATRLSRGWPGR